MALSHDEEVRAAAMAMACQYLIAAATFGAAGNPPATPTEDEMYAECAETANMFAAYITTGEFPEGHGASDVVTGR